MQRIHISHVFFCFFLAVFIVLQVCTQYSLLILIIITLFKKKYLYLNLLNEYHVIFRFENYNHFSIIQYTVLYYIQFFNFVRFIYCYLQYNFKNNLFYIT